MILNKTENITSNNNNNKHKLRLSFNKYRLDKR